MTLMNEARAREILYQAIREDRAGEFLDCLFNGGSATVGADGKLCLASSEELASLEPVDHDEIANNILAAGAVYASLLSARVKAEPVYDGDVVTNVIAVRFDFLRSPYHVTIERFEEPF